MIDNHTDRSPEREREREKHTDILSVPFFWRILTNTLEEEGLDLGLNGRRNAVGSVA